MNYKFFVQKIKDVDITKVGIIYSVCINDLSDEQLNKLGYVRSNFSSDVVLQLDSVSIKKLGIRTVSNCEYDESIYKYILSGCLDLDYKHFLVYCKGLSDNRCISYEITDDINQFFVRQYKVGAAYPDEAIGVIGKICRFREYMGNSIYWYSTYVVGLTEEEYQQICKDGVIDFMAMVGLLNRLIAN